MAKNAREAERAITQLKKKVKKRVLYGRDSADQINIANILTMPLQVNSI